MHHRFAQLCLVLALVMGWAVPSAYGNLLGLSKRELHDVMTLGRAISELQPRLDDEKSVQYALGIYKAAKHYRIDPRLLIAIAHQETSFRENLPEGAAGEIGLCQIRKNWLSNGEFVKEFGKRSIRDLHSPEQNFLFAAWILRDLKDANPQKETVPWWTYYNARKLKNRVQYYMHVNRKLERIHKYGPVRTAERVMASTTSEDGIEKLALGSAPQPKSARPKSRVRVPSKNDFVYTASAGPSTTWISNAVNSLSKQGGNASEGKWSGHHSPKKGSRSPSLRRTISELGTVN
ncbi:MAG: transglycosylase SLT domain-containing protein [Bdellovibrionales bacterium]|nr:transglycosylase SLT domain-containing protein [Bdellovibrionales bacterium]